VWGGGGVVGVWGETAGGVGGWGGGGINISISCGEFSGGKEAALLRQLCLRDDCYSFWFST